MIKVLNITEEGRGGGALFRIITVATSLKDDIHTVVLCPVESKNYQERLAANNVQFIPVRLTSLSLSTSRLMTYIVRFIPEVLSLSRAIKRIQPDLVHVNGSWQIKGIIASFLTGRRCIWHLNDTYQHLVILFLFSLLSRIPSFYLFASQATKNYYTRWIRKNHLDVHSRVIQAPIDMTVVSRPRKRTESGEWRAVMIGYINKNKGIELLIEASSLAKDRKLKIDIVGPVINTQESYWNDLDMMLRKYKVTNIEFLGYREVNSQSFKDYDFYICSSRRESSPIAVWQAMSNGLPIISTDVGDVKQVIEKYQCGFIVKEFTVSSFIATIDKLLSCDQRQLNQMSHSAIKAAKELFDIEIIKEKYKEVYNQY